MIFTTNKPPNEWGKVLHDEDMAAAILDRILERGRLIHLDGPSGRTRHLNADGDLCNSTKRARISGISGPEYPEPTRLIDAGDIQRLIPKLTRDGKTPKAIAAEYAKGRLLLVGTVDLDARRAVIWNITQIAVSRKSEPLKLVQSLLIASSAIPGTFPPVMIDVEVGSSYIQRPHGSTMWRKVLE